MPAHLIVRDIRLTGTLRPRCGVVTTNRSTTLSSIFADIRARQDGSNPIDTLFILCHGYAGENTRARVCMDAGGMGLQLGSENVLHTNVSRWEEIAGVCSNIVVHACAASNTEQGNEGSTADGAYLMGALAIHTGATVYAADRIQWYNPATMNFGDWEGNLWRFTASGAPASIATSVPELSAVL